MKKIFLSKVLVLASLLFMATAPVMAASDYEIDPSHSSVIFAIKHFGAGHVYGRLNNPTGTLHFDEQNPENSYVVIQVKTVDIDTASQKRDAHLKSAEFFDVEKFPVISFKSRSVEKLDKEHYQIKGDLAFLGKTRAITVKAQLIGSGKDLWGGFRTGFESKFTIKRSDFGMNFMQGPLGDDVQIITSVEAVKK